jgi:hypothetical protein
MRGPNSPFIYCPHDVANRTRLRVDTTGDATTSVAHPDCLGGAGFLPAVARLVCRAGNRGGGRADRGVSHHSAGDDREAIGSKADVGLAFRSQRAEHRLSIGRDRTIEPARGIRYAHDPRFPVAELAGRVEPDTCHRRRARTGWWIIRRSFQDACSWTAQFAFLDNYFARSLCAHRKPCLLAGFFLTLFNCRSKRPRRRFDDHPTTSLFARTIV